MYAKLWKPDWNSSCILRVFVWVIEDDYTYGRGFHLFLWTLLQGIHYYYILNLLNTIYVQYKYNICKSFMMWFLFWSFMHLFSFLPNKTKYARKPHLFILFIELICFWANTDISILNLPRDIKYCIWCFYSHERCGAVLVSSSTKLFDLVSFALVKINLIIIVSWINNI